MQAMILAEDEEDRRAALAELLPLQRRDFEGIFEAMEGLPVTIRLLDPPPTSASSAPRSRSPTTSRSCAASTSRSCA
jgi:phosphoenolpyruvate synthase/pyruvate phosphate dikinase